MTHRLLRVLSVLAALGLLGCEVAGQLTLYDKGPYELSIGEVPDNPKRDSYPVPSSPGFMFQLKREF